MVLIDRKEKKSMFVCCSDSETSFASVNKQMLRAENSQHHFSAESSMPRSVRPRTIACPVKNCSRFFTNRAGLSNHMHIHRKPKATWKPSPVVDGPFPLGGFDGDFSSFNTPSPAPSSSEPDNLVPERPMETVTSHPLLNGSLTFFSCDTKIFICFCRPPM
jgi:hypothetical protein